MHSDDEGGWEPEASGESTEFELYWQTVKNTQEDVPSDGNCFFWASARQLISILKVRNISIESLPKLFLTLLSEQLPANVMLSAVLSDKEMNISRNESGVLITPLEFYFQKALRITIASQLDMFGYPLDFPLPLEEFIPKIRLIREALSSTISENSRIQSKSNNKDVNTDKLKKISHFLEKIENEITRPITNRLIRENELAQEGRKSRIQFETNEKIYHLINTDGVFRNNWNECVIFLKNLLMTNGYYVGDEGFMLMSWLFPDTVIRCDSHSFNGEVITTTQWYYQGRRVTRFADNIPTVHLTRLPWAHYNSCWLLLKSIYEINLQPTRLMDAIYDTENSDSETLEQLTRTLCQSEGFLIQEKLGNKKRSKLVNKKQEGRKNVKKIQSNILAESDLDDVFKDWSDTYRIIMNLIEKESYEKNTKDAFIVYLLLKYHYNANYSIEEIQNFQYQASPLQYKQSNSYLRTRNHQNPKQAMAVFNVVSEKLGEELNISQGEMIFVDHVNIIDELKQHVLFIEESQLSYNFDSISNEQLVFVNIVSEQKQSSEEVEEVYTQLINFRYQEELEQLKKNIKEDMLNMIKKGTPEKKKAMYNAYRLLKKEALRDFKDFEVNEVCRNELLEMLEIYVPNDNDVEKFYGRAFIKKGITEKIKENIIVGYIKEKFGFTILIVPGASKKALEGLYIYKSVGYAPEIITFIKNAIGLFQNHSEFMNKIIQSEAELAEKDENLKLSKWLKKLPTMKQNDSNNSPEQNIPHQFKKLRDVSVHENYQILINASLNIIIGLEILENKKRENKYILNEISAQFDFILKKFEDNKKAGICDDQILVPLIGNLQNIFEAIFLYIAIFKPNELSVNHAIRNIKDLESCFLQHVSLCNYGMKGFSQVLNSLKYTLEDKNDLEQIQVFNQVYFEHLLNMNNLITPPHLVRTIEGVTQNVRVVFMDTHPNNAVELELYNHNICALFEKLWIQYRERLTDKRGESRNFDIYKNKRITIVIDITLNALVDSEIKNILEKGRLLIINGLLNLVFIQSLTKYAQLGVDKLSAGLILVYNDGNEEYWEKFNANIKQYSQQEKIDPLIDGYFAAFLKYANCEQHQYLELIKKNTNYLYDKIDSQYSALQVQDEKRALELTCNTDISTCYIALNYSTFFNKEFGKDFFTDEGIKSFNKDVIYLLIFKISNLMKLPISHRQSLGFPISNINECNHTIRFTLGIEAQGILDTYANIFAYVCFALNLLQFEKIKVKDERGKVFKKLVDIYQIFNLKREPNSTLIECEIPIKNLLLNAQSILFKFERGKILGRIESSPMDFSESEISCSLSGIRRLDQIPLNLKCMMAAFIYFGNPEIKFNEAASSLQSMNGIRITNFEYVSNELQKKVFYRFDSLGTVTFCLNKNSLKLDIYRELACDIKVRGLFIHKEMLSFQNETTPTKISDSKIKHDAVDLDDMSINPPRLGSTHSSAFSAFDNENWEAYEPDGFDYREQLREEFNGTSIGDEDHVDFNDLGCNTKKLIFTKIPYYYLEPENTLHGTAILMSSRDFQMYSGFTINNLKDKNEINSILKVDLWGIKSPFINYMCQEALYNNFSDKENEGEKENLVIDKSKRNLFDECTSNLVLYLIKNHKKIEEKINQYSNKPQHFVREIGKYFRGIIEMHYARYLVEVNAINNIGSEKPPKFKDKRMPTENKELKEIEKPRAIAEQTREIVNQLKAALYRESAQTEVLKNMLEERVKSLQYMQSQIEKLEKLLLPAVQQGAIPNPPLPRRLGVSQPLSASSTNPIEPLSKEGPVSGHIPSIQRSTSSLSSSSSSSRSSPFLSSLPGSVQRVPSVTPASHSSSSSQQSSSSSSKPRTNLASLLTLPPDSASDGGITLTREEIQVIMEEAGINVPNQGEVAEKISHALSAANIDKDNTSTEVNKIVNKIVNKVCENLKLNFESTARLHLTRGIIANLLSKMRSVQTKSSQMKDSGGLDRDRSGGDPSSGAGSGGSSGGAGVRGSDSSKRNPEAGIPPASSPDRSFSGNSREKEQAGEELKTATEVSNQGTDSFLSSSTLKRKGLSMQDNEDKRLIDYYFEQGIFVGNTYDNGDCFFDSVSQSLGGSHSYKELRELCASYIEEDAQKTGGWVKLEMAKDARTGELTYDECRQYVRYIASEIDRPSTWGRPNVEGRMICEKLNKSLYWTEYMPYRTCQLFYIERVPENPPKVGAGEVAIVIVNELGGFKAYFAAEDGWLKDTVTSQLKIISALKFDPSVQGISPESITPEGDCKYDYDVFGDYLKTAKRIIDSAKRADILDEHIVAIKYTSDRYVIKPGQVQKQALETDFQEPDAVYLIVKKNHFMPLLRTPGLKLQQRPDKQTPSVTAQVFQQSSSSSSKPRTKLASSPPVSQMSLIPPFVKPETSTVTSKTTSTTATLTAMPTASAQQTSSSSSTHLSDNVEQCQVSASSKQIDTDVPVAGAALLYLQTIHANAGSQTSAVPVEEKQPRVLRER